MNRQVITSSKPLIVSYNYEDSIISYVLNPYFDDKLIKFITDNNLQIGDDITEKYKEINNIS